MLITARLAADFGRDVFAVPGSVFSPTSEGAHLLKTARSCAGAPGRLAELFPSVGQPRPPVSSPAAAPRLSAGRGACSSCSRAGALGRRDRPRARPAGGGGPRRIWARGRGARVGGGGQEYGWGDGDAGGGDETPLLLDAYASRRSGIDGCCGLAS
jgi:hypothetical protein